MAEIAVASSVYSLAGEESSQPDFLRSLITRGVLSNDRKTSLGEIIQNGYITGKGIQMRNFFRWSDENYTYLGLPQGSIAAGNGVSPSLIAPHIVVEDGTANVTDAKLAYSDFSMWVEQWFLINDPGNYSSGQWSADINPTNNLITISYTNGTFAYFYPTNYSPGTQSIIAYYTELKNPEYDPISFGSPVSLGPDDNWPDIVGWGEKTNTSTHTPVTLHRETIRTVSYDDGTPDEVTEENEDIEANYSVTVRAYQRDTNLGQDPKTTDPRIILRRETYNFFQNAEIEPVETTTTTSRVVGGVTVTITTVTTLDTIMYLRSYRKDTQMVYTSQQSGKRLFIYRIGSGNPVLDNVVSIVASYGKFFPIIPLRINNTNVSEANNPTLYKQSKAATKRALQSKGAYDKLLKEIADNPDVGDIDYAYLVFGTSLNSVNKGSKVYIYDFIKRLLVSSSGSFNSIKIATDGAGTNYDMTISWLNMDEAFAAGVSRSGAKKGDIWMTSTEGTSNLPPGSVVSANTGYVKPSDFWIYNQYDDNAYSRIYIRGFLHTNNVYGNKVVTITAHEALQNAKNSGFILPLHMATFREMALTDSTQMGVATGYIVFNSYEEREVPWWQQGWFSFLLVIVGAILSVVFTGGAGLGLLGAHFAVGATMGLTGMAAAIAGSIVNAIAAMVLTMLITQVSTALFGDALGPIIATILGMLAMNFITNLHTTGTLGLNFGQLFSADNLLKLTNAAVDGYTAMLNSQISGLQADMKTLQEKTDAELKRIREQFMSEFGYGGGQIDPLMFVGNSPVMAESRDTFLTRTLLTGSQIASLSHDVINDFTDLSLTLPNAFS